MNERRLSVTNSLIIINIVVFVAGVLAQRPAVLGVSYPGGSPTSVFEVLGAYSWFSCFMQGELWRVISYQFVHADFGHLLFNMWALYFFGPAVECVMGSKRYLAFYLVCGISGALFSSFLSALGLYAPGNSLLPACNELAAFAGYNGMVEVWQMIPLIGASAALYGVMIAAAFLYPEARISLLFPPITLKLRTFALSVVGIASFIILFNLDNAGGEAGHLGGIIMGALIMYIGKLRREQKLPW